jgi:serine/threonine protein phosphatase 1
MEQRIFIVGDIHGCLNPLKTLMETIDWRPDQDRLIFIGDYIDRGENSKGVVDYILELMNRSSLIQCLKGNHEDMLLNYFNNGDIGTYLYNGGRTTLTSYTKSNGDVYFPSDHISFFQSLLTLIELDDYYVVHAGLQPGVDIHKQTLRDLLWIRDPFIFSDYDFGKKVIFGHTPFSAPLVMETKIGLDTGAVYGNRLTCLELPNMTFHSVEA